MTDEVSTTQFTMLLWLVSFPLSSLRCEDANVLIDLHCDFIVSVLDGRIARRIPHFYVRVRTFSSIDHVERDGFGVGYHFLAIQRNNRKVIVNLRSTRARIVTSSRPVTVSRRRC